MKNQVFTRVQNPERFCVRKCNRQIVRLETIRLENEIIIELGRHHSIEISSFVGLYFFDEAQGVDRPVRALECRCERTKLFRGHVLCRLEESSNSCQFAQTLIELGIYFERDRIN